MKKSTKGRTCVAKKRFRKTKITIFIIYIIILVFYGLFVFQTFQTKQAGEDFHVFGNYLYALEDQHSLAISEVKEEYQKGDQIIYRTEDGLQTAKIDTVLTQNNEKVVTLVSNQDHISYDFIIAAVKTDIPYLGAVFEFLQTTLAVICIVVVPCALFVVYQIVQLIRTVKHGKKSEENQKNEELMMEDKLSNIQTPTMELSKQNISQQFAAITQPTGEQGAVPKESSKPLSNELKIAPSEESLDQVLDEMKYKMKFQDTYQLSKHMESVIDEQPEMQSELAPYGLQTKQIEDGIEIQIDSSKTKDITIRLKKDGSLTLITENYQAEINSDI